MRDERPKRGLAADELRRLLDAIPERRRLLYELTSETRARKGEALGLAWEYVDFDSETVKFTHQLDRSAGAPVENGPLDDALAQQTDGSALIAAGCGVEEVSARFGHADVTTTLREYTHAYDAASAWLIGANG